MLENSFKVDFGDKERCGTTRRIGGLLEEEWYLQGHTERHTIRSLKGEFDAHSFLNLPSANIWTTGTPSVNRNPNSPARVISDK